MMACRFTQEQLAKRMDTTQAVRRVKDGGGPKLRLAYSKTAKFSPLRNESGSNPLCLLAL